MRKVSFTLVIVILFTIVLFFTGCYGENAQEPLDTSPVDEETEREKTEGEETEGEETHEVFKVSPALAIIDNNPQARPQSGLQHATIVYEFLVEGGLTRFLAVFDTLPEENYLIGPIRSLRPYFAHQAAEHGGAVAYSGYSERTKALIKGIPLKHIVSSSYLWRDSSRKAPHNLYTDINKLFKAAGYDGEFAAVTASPPKMPDADEDGSNVEVPYSKNNKVSYTYNPNSGTYERFINGKPHTDRDTGLQYNVRRIILRATPHTNVPDTNLIDIAITGEGSGLLFEEGFQYKVKWKHKNGVTTYHHTDGTLVDLSYGNTWVQVVR